MTFVTRRFVFPTDRIQPPFGVADLLKHFMFSVDVSVVVFDFELFKQHSPSFFSPICVYDASFNWLYSSIIYIVMFPSI